MRRYGCIAGLLLLNLACSSDPSERIPGTRSDAAVISDAEIDGGEDAATADAGPMMDAGTPPADAGEVMDAGALDTGPGDTGATDTGPTDTGPTDTGPTDTGPTDTGPTDLGVPPPDGGAANDTGIPDFGIPFPDGGFLNDGSIPDFGIPFPDGGFLNDGSIPDFGIPFPDGGFLNDGSIPDFGIPFPDGGLFDDGGLVLPDGGTATMVSITQATVWMNLQPPTAADPLQVQIQLEFNNPSAANENITITTAVVVGLSLQSTFTGQFANGSATHVATPGTTNATFTKDPNGAPIANPQAACNTAGVLILSFSGGLPVTTAVTINCVF